MDIVRQFTDDHLAYWSDFETRVATFTAPNEHAVGIEPALGIITEPRDPTDLGVACACRHRGGRGCLKRRSTV